MPKYKVKHTSIMHNSKVYPEGSEIVLTEDCAKRLSDFLDLIPGTENLNSDTEKPDDKSGTGVKTTKTTKSMVKIKVEKEETETGSKNKNQKKAKQNEKTVDEAVAEENKE